ncbi:MAG: helix-turn-helix domain-containing protein [Leptospirales bacterium]|nr:helix-turn-helix domain-containing protein [Leptospirales bacterium]
MMESMKAGRPGEIKTLSFRRRTPPEIEVLNMERMLRDHHRTATRPHRTDFYHILFFGRCAPVHRVDFQEVAVTPRSLLFLAREQIHQFDAVRKYSGQALIFTASFFCQSAADSDFLRGNVLFNQILSGPLLQTDRETHARLRTILNWITEELQFGAAANPAILKQLVHLLLLLAERKIREGLPQARRSSREIQRTLAFRELIEKQYIAEKRVSYYAKRLMLPARDLAKATLRVTGKTPKQMIDDRLFLEAKRLLAHGDESVGEIARRLGFDEATNFAKYFRKHALLAPLEFRRSAQALPARADRSRNR